MGNTSQPWPPCWCCVHQTRPDPRHSIGFSLCAGDLNPWPRILGVQEPLQRAAGDVALRWPGLLVAVGPLRGERAVQGGPERRLGRSGFRGEGGWRSWVDRQTGVGVAR